MSGKVSSATDVAVVGSSTQCPVCNAIPLASTDQFCRRCGCQLNLTCRHCRASIKALDRYCASCGARRLIIFDQLRRGIYVNSPYIIIGTAVIVASAWLALRYALRNKLR